jgi:cystathionine beta-synthase
VVTTPTAVERDAPESYYSVADRLTREVPGAFQPNQYFNPMNPRTHYESTGPEIWEQTGGSITHFVAGVGTGGTVSGISRFLKEKNPDVVVIGADPEGSIYTSDHLHTYKVEGVGEDFWPGTFDRNSVDQWVQVSDRDSFLTARAITRQEGILTGGSGGLAAWAALKVAREIDDPDALVVVLLPDSGRGYLSKLYSDDWMRENGFLSRFSGPTRLGQLIAGFSPELPDVIAVACDDTIEQAIEVLRFHEISQVPVVRSRQQADGIEIQSIVGSIQERTLLDHLFRNPEIVSAQVSSIMDAPFNLVDANEEIERVFPLFGGGAPAVLVQQDGKLVGVVTRSDLLEFAARQPKRRD